MYSNSFLCSYECVYSYASQRPSPMLLLYIMGDPDPDPRRRRTCRPQMPIGPISRAYERCSHPIEHLSIVLPQGLRPGYTGTLGLADVSWHMCSDVGPGHGNHPGLSFSYARFPWARPDPSAWIGIGSLSSLCVCRVRSCHPRSAMRVRRRGCDSAIASTWYSETLTADCLAKHITHWNEPNYVKARMCLLSISAS